MDKIETAADLPFCMDQHEIEDGKKRKQKPKWTRPILLSRSRATSLKYNQDKLGAGMVSMFHRKGGESAVVSDTIA